MRIQVLLASVFILFSASVFSQEKPENQYGKLEKIRYYSVVSEDERVANVILPAGYDKSSPMPVLYLLHGIGGDENEWLGARPVETLGKMIAKGEASKMIVVIPNIRVHKHGTKEPGFFSRERFKEFDVFIDELQKSLMPEIEKRYSVATDRESQAIAGLSMGGREALYIGVKLCDKFAYVGAFEPAPGVLPYPAEPGLLTKETATFPEEYKNSTYLLITKGTRDSVVGANPKTYADVFEANGVDPHFTELEGGHDFSVWKASLELFARRIFSKRDAQ